jgi:hypothetical protein
MVSRVPAATAAPAPSTEAVDRAGQGITRHRHHRSLADHQQLLVDQG